MTATANTRPFRSKYAKHVLDILQEAGTPLTSSAIASRLDGRMHTMPQTVIDVPTIGDVCKRMHDAGMLERHVPNGATATTGYRWSVKVVRGRGEVGSG